MAFCGIDERWAAECGSTGPFLGLVTSTVPPPLSFLHQGVGLREVLDAPQKVDTQGCWDWILVQSYC